jgi:hypothetical protein
MSIKFATIAEDLKVVASSSSHYSQSMNNVVFVLVKKALFLSVGLLSESSFNTNVGQRLREVERARDVIVNIANYICNQVESEFLSEELVNTIEGE